MSNNAVIIKIDLSIHPEDFIKRQLSQQDDATRGRIEKAIKQKKIVESARIATQEKTREQISQTNQLFTKLFESGNEGLKKEELIQEMLDKGMVKSSSGATLKLKTLVKKEMVGYELKVTPSRYIIQKTEA